SARSAARSCARRRAWAARDVLRSCAIRPARSARCSRRREMKLSLASFVLGCALLLPQEPRVAPAAAPASTPVRATARPVVIGASLSAGFCLTHTFAQAFEASLAGTHEPVRSHASELLFLDARHTGANEAGEAADDVPSLVLAVDFLFWFGYGTFDAEGGGIDDEDERVALLERGLKLLEDFECPLVVSDFPDMSAAIGPMLVAEQVPKPETLARLSKRVREWAAPRKNV